MSADREALIDFANAIEAAVVKLKMNLGAETTQQTIKWNPLQIRWSPKEGTHGPYDFSDDINNPEFKAMLKDLEAHQGKLTRDGSFYWIFQNGASVGCKPKFKKD